MATDQSADVQRTIVDIARQLHVDPTLALADATVESGLNPNAVGDHGTSFGLFQLHSGGELEALKGNLDAQKKQAFDPATNAKVALAEFARVAKAHPDWTPGHQAAAAQRPADQAGYAKKVDALYASLTTSGRVHNIDTYSNASDTAAKTTGEANSTVNKALNSGVADSIAGAVEDPFGVKTLLGKVSSTSFLTRLAFIFVGLIVLSIGVAKLTNVSPTEVAKGAVAA